MPVVPIRRAALFVALVIALFAALAVSASAASDTARYIVVLKDSVDHPGAVAAEQAQEVDGDVSLVYRTALKGYAAVLPRDEVEKLKSDPRVDYVTPDRKVEATELTSPVYLQETPTGVARTGAAANPEIDVDAVDDLRVDADVAVIDSGIDFQHPDLNVPGGTNCVPANGTEYTSKVCVDGASADLLGHGTHVAGIVGAKDNQFGVVGIAPGARVWSVRVLNGAGNGYESWIAAGVDWVTAHSSSIEVANLSLGCQCEMPALEEAISASVEAGVVYTVAAGNSHKGAIKFAPAKNPDVITVSAIADYDGIPGGLGEVEPSCEWPYLEHPGLDDHLFTFSNFDLSVEVAAPGVCILSTTPGGTYGYKTGTSMAAPYVAGAAAILASQSNPSSKKDVEAIRQTIIKEGNFEWVDDLSDNVKEPLLDVSDTAVFNPPVRARAVTESSTGLGETSATLHATINPNGVLAEYQFEYGTSTSYGAKVPIPAGYAGGDVDDLEVSETITGLSPGTTYHYRVVVTNEDGTTKGADMQFRTFGAPTATSKGAIKVHKESALLLGTVNPNGKATEYQFEYGKTTAYGTKVPVPAMSVGVGGEDVNVSQLVSGLEPETEYHYRVVASNELGAATSGDQQFTTHTPESTLTLSFGEYGFAENQLRYPAALAADAEGDVWIADTFGSRVVEFSSEGEFIQQVGAPGGVYGELQSPEGIAVDSKGNVWVADTGASRLLEFNSKGGFIRQVGSAGSTNGKFLVPTGVAIDSEDHVWVADTINNRVQEFSPSGTFVRQFGSSGLNGPIGIDTDPEGDVWVTDGSNRAKEFSPTGEYLGQIGGDYGEDPHGFVGMSGGLAIDSEGDIWLSDMVKGTVAEFEPSGGFIQEFGEGGLSLNWGPSIAIDGNDGIWVANYHESQIQKWKAGE